MFLGEKFRPIYKKPESKQESKEREEEKKLDTVIVFGQGPVKPLLLPEELSSKEMKKWEEFKKDPFRNKEPDFQVIKPNELIELERIEKNQGLTPEEREKLKKLKIQGWQRKGDFALKRFGRMNAYATGLLLCTGQAKELILTGGRTKPNWVEKRLPKERIKNWPSEAKLMKDLIIKRFGKIYEKKFNQPIEKAIKIEDKATNTLENIALSINKHPEILSKERKIGILSTAHHLERIGIISYIFSIKAKTKIPAQEKVKEEKITPRRIKKLIEKLESSSEIQELTQGEERWKEGLLNPEYLSYWLGYLGIVENPNVLGEVFKALNDPKWIESAKKEFEKVGLNFDDFKEKDLLKLQ